MTADSHRAGREQAYGSAFHRPTSTRSSSSGGARYLRRVKNFSDEGLLLENPLADAFPGQHVELELPRQGQLPLKVEGEIVYVTPRGASASA